MQKQAIKDVLVTKKMVNICKNSMLVTGSGCNQLLISSNCNKDNKNMVHQDTIWRLLAYYLCLSFNVFLGSSRIKQEITIHNNNEMDIIIGDKHVHKQIYIIGKIQEL